jgi:hypothetical protein
VGNISRKETESKKESKMKLQDMKYFSSLTRFQSKVREALGKDISFTQEAFLAIWDKQTTHEKIVGDTMLKNHVGFDAWTAKKLSNIAKNIEAGYQVTSDDSLKIAKEMKKYIEQLFLIVHNRV